MFLKQGVCGVLFILFLASCGGSDNGTGGDGNTTQAPPYFPNAVGTEWQYKVYDHLQDNYDTITVTIVGQTSLTDVARQASIWIFSPCGRPEDDGYANLYDTLFVVAPGSSYDGVDEDSVVIYSSSNPVKQFIKIMLPLEIGNGVISAHVIICAPTNSSVRCVSCSYSLL